MSSNTLDELGRAILEVIEDEPTTVETLEATFETSRETLEDRLAQLVDNALAREVNDGEYELTDNGLRVLRATPIGKYDNRIDTPSAVAQSIEEFSLPPDEAGAVRNTFSFLQYWGDATTAELVDGCYSESPAGYDTAEGWWANCVADRLGALPLVDPPQTDPTVRTGSTSSSASDDSSKSIRGLWEYEGTPVVETPDDEDGRAVPDPQSTPSPFASVRHGLETMELSEGERTAARVAFAVLYDRKTAPVDELVESVYSEYSAGYDSSDEWETWISEVFDALPGIERDSETADELVWRYGPPPGQGDRE